MSDTPAPPVIPFITPEFAWMMTLLSQTTTSVPLHNDMANTSLSQDTLRILPPVVPTLDTFIRLLNQVRDFFLASSTTNALPTQGALEFLPPVVPNLDEYVRMRSQEIESTAMPTTENGIHDEAQSQKAEISVVEIESIGVPSAENIRCDQVQLEEAEPSVTATEVELYPVPEDGENNDLTESEIAQIPLPPPVTEDNGTPHTRAAHRKCQRCSNADHTWVECRRRNGPYCGRESVDGTYIYGCGIRSGSPRSSYRGDSRRLSLASEYRDRENEYKKSTWRRFPKSSSSVGRRVERSRFVEWRPARNKYPYMHSDKYARRAPYATRRWP